MGIELEMFFCFWCMGCYVYLTIEKRKIPYERIWRILDGVLLIAGAAIGCLWEESILLGAILLYEIKVFLYARKRRLRLLFAFAHPFAFLNGLYLLGGAVELLIRGSKFGLVEENGQLQFDLFDLWTISALIMFGIFGRKYRKDFWERTRQKQLKRPDEKILRIVSMGFYFFVCVLEVTEDIFKQKEKRQMMGVFLLVMGSALFYILKEQRKQWDGRFYYQDLADLNARYVEMEGEYFKAYQRKQEETRSLRHDMKNHIQVMSGLIERGQIEAFQEYVSQINGRLEELSLEFCTGNTFLDAVLNAKQSRAQKQGCKLEVEGYWTDKVSISASDLCTVTANAIDNAIEELGRFQAEDKKISVRLEQQGALLFLTVRNEKKEKKISLLTKKKEKQSHGYGMANMKKIVSDYHGSLQIHSEQQEGRNYFILEIMLVCPAIRNKEVSVHNKDQQN